MDSNMTVSSCMLCLRLAGIKWSWPGIVIDSSRHVFLCAGFRVNCVSTMSLLTITKDERWEEHPLVHLISGFWVWGVMVRCGGSSIGPGIILMVWVNSLVTGWTALTFVMNQVRPGSQLKPICSATNYATPSPIHPPYSKTPSYKE